MLPAIVKWHVATFIALGAATSAAGHAMAVSAHAGTTGATATRIHATQTAAALTASHDRLARRGQELARQRADCGSATNARSLGCLQATDGNQADVSDAPVSQVDGLRVPAAAFPSGVGEAGHRADPPQHGSTIRRAPDAGDRNALTGRAPLTTEG